MNQYITLSFDEISGFDGGADAKARPKLSDAKGISSPCEDCVCQYVCAGADCETGKPDWGQAMCCTLFQRFVRVTKTDKGKVKKPNRMPSRAVYVKLFGEC